MCTAQDSANPGKILAPEVVSVKSGPADGQADWKLEAAGAQSFKLMAQGTAVELGQGLVKSTMT